MYAVKKDKHHNNKAGSTTAGMVQRKMGSNQTRITTAKKVKVIFMYYFLICFYVLDYCFFSNRELMMKNDDLGLLLGTMDPDMLTDGTPVDPAVLDDWNSIFKSVPSSDHELIDLIDSFLEYYEKNEGFDFPFARKILKQNEVLNYVKTAKEKALETCKKYDY